MIRSRINKSCLFFSGLSKLLVFSVVTFALFSATAQAATPPSILSEALDTDLIFTTGGSADWFGQTTTSYYGGDAAESGDISHGQESWMQTTVSGTGTVKFYWKISSEECCDELMFYIDGLPLGLISGSVDWQEETNTISTSGTHVLEWRYVKDASVDSDIDSCWVDRVEWGPISTPTPKPPPKPTPTPTPKPTPPPSSDSLSEAMNTSLIFITGGSADWFGQTTTSYYGADAAQSGDISHGQDSWMQTKVNGQGTVSFYWKVSSQEKSDFLEFYIDGSLQDRISGLVDWQQKTYTITTSGSHALEWRYVKSKDGSMDSGSDSGWVDKVEWVAPTYVLSEVLDTALSFTTGGSANWFSQTTTSYYGGYAAQSGDISHGQDSWMQTTVSGARTVKFYWKVSSENGYDFLEFYIDGWLRDRISGSVDWQQKMYTITTSGSHTLEWRYVKDGSTDLGSDCGWVDKVEWMPTNLVGHWEMDDNTVNTIVVDNSGNGNNGTAQRYTQDMHTTGVIDGAFNFNGTSDYIDLWDISFPSGNSPRSVSFWINDVPSTENHYIFFYGKTSINNRFSICRDNRRGEKLKIIAYGNDWDTGYILPTGVWKHVAFTFDGSTVKLYIDGSLVASTTTTYDTILVNKAYIGCHEDMIAFFEGMLDDLAVFDKALSEGEIEALYVGEATTPKPPPSSLSEALDTTLSFTLGGSADWFDQTTTSYFGGEAAQNGDISHGQDSWMQTTVEGKGMVKFYWKVSSEEGYDFLEFYIDGSLGDRISGSVDWQQKTYMVGTSGSHTLEWRYVKDGSVDFGSDSSWVDKVEWVLTHLVGHWGMDDNAANTIVVDNSGSGNNGTAQRNTQEMHTIGVVDGAFNFDGTSDYIDLGNISLPSGNSPRSISFWINDVASTNNHYIFFYGRTSINNRFSICKDNRRGEKLKVIAYGNDWDTGYVLPTGVWKHVAFTFDSRAIELYIDGSLVASTTATYDTILVDRAYIGRHEDMVAFFEGMLDDLVVFDKALSEGEIKALYAGGGINPQTPPDSLSEALDTTLGFTLGGSADWFDQSMTSYYGAEAAQSGDISHSQDSWMQTTVEGRGTVKFYWKVSSEDDYDFLEFYVDGWMQDRINGSVDWQQKTYTIFESGSHTLEWRYVKDGSGDFGSDCGWVDKVEWVPTSTPVPTPTPTPPSLPQTLSEALDTTLSVTVGGTVADDWFYQTTTSYYDGDAAQSGDTLDEEVMRMQTTVSGPGTIKFYWKVSSELGYDFLYFYIDGSQQDRISGEVDWQQKTYTISTSGLHTLEWQYAKDETDESGSDCGWVDKVEWITP
ncbi:MAG: LamG domain-containing protein [Planctomycetota bacterium]|jgi:hypothetical protein